mgnify:CR=1 FL=1
MAHEFFGRKMSVLIGDENSSIEIKDVARKGTNGATVNLKMTAKIVKDAKTGEDDFCELAIYNLSETTRELFNTQYTKMILTAGYGEKVGVMFTGDIQSSTHTFEGQDWVTRVIASDGGRALDQALINKTYKKGTTLGQMMEDFQNISGIPELSMINVDVDKVLERGKTINGMMRETITDIGNSNGFDWSVQDGSLIAVDAKVARSSQQIVVSAQTGMIGSPEWINTGTSKAKAQTEEGTKLKVVSLCQIAIKPFDKIFVQSVALRGRIGGISIDINPTQLIGEFKVLKITHELDSFDGDFKSTIECQLTGTEYLFPEDFSIDKLIQNVSEGL